MRSFFIHPRESVAKLPSHSALLSLVLYLHCKKVPESQTPTRALALVF